MRARIHLSRLLAVTLLNYAAQIPYYLHNYYFPYRVPPTVSSVVLLSLTLAWFLAGYVGFAKRWKPAFYVLVSFLIVEALFYFHSFIFGAFFFQMRNPSLINKAIFGYGYISGIVAGWYAYQLVVRRGAAQFRYRCSRAR